MLVGCMLGSAGRTLHRLVILLDIHRQCRPSILDVNPCLLRHPSWAPSSIWCNFNLLNVGVRRQEVEDSL